MEQDKEVTKVIFRVITGRYGKGEIIALFPEIANDSQGNCLSYMHVGQHGGADYLYMIQTSKLATPEQYAPLLQELESLGYNLKVCKRRSWDMTYKMLHGEH